MKTSFDVLIVGAGSAGCVLAARLSESPALQVGLIEAGGPATDPDIAIPQQWPVLAGRAYDWGYRTMPQAGTAGRRHDWPRGRLIGGSSCLNAMAHVRGSRDDFRAWMDATDSARWSYEGLLPAFRRLESFSGGLSEHHGADGPLPAWPQASRGAASTTPADSSESRRIRPPSATVAASRPPTPISNPSSRAAT